MLFVIGLLIPVGVQAGGTDADVERGPQGVPATLTEPGCIPNVVGQFNELKHHGEALGFHLGDSPDPTLGKHYQGIQRLPGEGTPYFAISRNANRNIGDPISFNEPGNLVVVRFGSRDTDGERLRSNRLEKGRETKDTIPPADDRAVTTIYFDGNGWPDYRHAGGMQTYGDLLFVALDNEGPTAPSPGMVALIDMSDPENPQLINEFSFPHVAGAVAVARHPTANRHLMIVEGPDDNDTLKVYLSNGYDLDHQNLDFHLIDEWHGSELIGGSWPTGTGAHQTLNLIEDCQDGIYLLGARNDPGLPEFGDDYATVYKLEIGTDNELELTQASNGHFFCVSAAGRICNFVAAAGFYTSPIGELILYSTEHENEGPSELPIVGPWSTVRMGEFRHEDTYRPASPAWAPTAIAGPDDGYVVPEGSGTVVNLDGGQSSPPIAEPWVELYDDAGFMDRSIVIDYADRFKDDWHNFNHLDDAAWDLELGFNDKTSAARWAAPVGCDIVLYEDDNYGGDNLVLTGTGEVEEISDFDDYGFGDTASSMQFVGACDTGITHRWDLDGDLIFEVNGVSTSYDTAGADGPATINVRLQVCGPFYNFCPQDVVPIQVANVPPTIDDITTNSPVFQGTPAVISVTASDPAGVDDPLTFDFDCDGDGGYETAGSGNTGTCPLNPAVAVSTIGVQVSDDDGGATTATVEIEQVILLCLNAHTAALNVPGTGDSCAANATPIVLPASEPTRLCGNPFTGGLHVWVGAVCPSGWIAHLVPGDGPLSYCANPWTRGLRYSSDGTCAPSEQAGVVPG